MLNAISDPAAPDNSTTKSNVSVPLTEYPLQNLVVAVPSEVNDALAETATPSFSNHTHLIADLSDRPVLSNLTDSIVIFSEALKSTALNTTVATAGADLTSEE